MKKFKKRLSLAHKRRFIIIILSSFMLWIMPAASYAVSQQQTYSVKGTVIDNSGIPLPGVTVLLKGTSLGTSTGNDGTFIMNLPQSQGTLVISFIGYQTQEIPFEPGKTVSVRLKEALNNLDEVQVIAYGKQSKRDFIGAMSVVSSEDIKDIPSPSIANLLQGKVAGMNVTNMTGSPGGGGTSITIRGFNSLSIEASRRYSDPLWVIDGVPMLTFTSPITGTNALAEIDPNDIESISVLKDAASASIYGSRAANGVILVTTKHGRYNQRPKISLNLSQTIVCLPTLPEFTRGKAERQFRTEALKNYRQATLDPETGKYRYMQSYWDSYVNGSEYDYFWNNGEGRDVPILNDSYDPFYNNSTNWFKYYFQRAQATDANLQINGGAENIAYNIGLGWYQEKGSIIKTGFKRFKVISNITMKPHERIEANLRLYLAYTNRDRTGKGSGIYTSETSAYLEQIPEGAFKSTLEPDPDNPLLKDISQSYESLEEKNDSYRVRGSFDLTYQILPGLSFKGSLSLDFSQQNQNQFIPAELNPYNETYSAGLISRNINWVNEDVLTYKHTFAEAHNVDLLVGFSAQADESHLNSGSGQDGPNNLTKVVSWANHAYNSLRQEELKDFMTNFEKSTLVGLFARASYNYKQKYLLSATLRRDASSKFGENVRWGTFPSIALGYAFSEENYMQPIKHIVNYAKIRASYGKTGRQFDQPYIAYGVWTSGSTYLGNTTTEPLFTEGLMNKELTWEETKQLDLGLDLDLLDYRLGIVVDFYHRNTDKLLYKVDLPGNYTGFAKQWRNAYCIINKGIEFQIKADLIRNEKFKWNLTFNIAKNWNMLKKSNNGMDFQAATSQDNINVIGRPLNGIYVLKDNGIYNKDADVPTYFIDGKKVPLRGEVSNQFYAAGDRIYLDADGNGQIMTNYSVYEDRVYAGSPLPKAQGGIINSLSWKGFDANISFTYQLGRHILNRGRGQSIATTLGFNPNEVAKPIFADLDKITFWEKTGDNADYPANRLDNGLKNFATNISSNVEKVNFLKLKSVVLGYTLPPSVKKTLGFDARIYLSAENLFTVTNYSGTDPETVDIATGIDDLSNYPLARKFTFGLTLNF